MIYETNTKKVKSRRSIEEALSKGHPSAAVISNSGEAVIISCSDDCEPPAGSRLRVMSWVEFLAEEAQNNLGAPLRYFQ